MGVGDFLPYVYHLLIFIIIQVPLLFKVAIGATVGIEILLVEFYLLAIYCDTDKAGRIIAIENE